MNDKYIPKSVKEKLRLADRGDLFSCFTVGEYYIDGKTLDIDEKKSDGYFSKVADELHGSNIRVKNLELYDYKKFERANLSLSKKQTTILIGSNGSGKSTILEGLAKNLQFLVDNIRVRNNNHYKFDDNEININTKNKYAITKCSLTLNDEYTFSCSLTKNYENVARKVQSELEQFKLLGAMHQESDRLRGDDFPYPLFAYYPIERTVLIKREDVERKQNKRSRKSIFNKIEGLNKAFDGSSNFDTFFGWYKEIDDIINEQSSKNNLSPEAIREALLKAESEGRSAEDLGKLISNLLDSKESNTDNTLPKKLEKQSKVIVEAIKNFLTGVQDVEITRTPVLDMYVKSNDLRLSVFNMSQGEKTLLALVSDIARRLVTLNPNSSAPLNGNGVVLIDELDLHLHPQWQQTIIKNLERTFPNVQFIISTHSPLILTTVTSEQIKILTDEVNVQEIKSPKSNPFGKVSSEALAIMNTPEKPEIDVELSILINRYEELVKLGLEESDEAQGVLVKLQDNGYSIDESQLELWRFIASNAELFNDSKEGDL
ncbi:AAA family ATPase [Vibrio parahaemolyticus]|uniref:AAA family ATPase n=1 Tax=Vibrio parahaemolyticus TaxID=670 RepID=UPI001869FAAB|nr:AAA family ATPase [Vibrio parahaemolyticus]HCG6537994.1 AAA family ATPase [Vibrio parahaemolyticus]HCH0791329.1 AAA family ATPase [Vibrio parahaemolyticus]